MLGFEDNDKENSFIACREKDKDATFSRNKVLSSIDNTAMYTRSTNLKTELFTNQFMPPKAWAWDAKWTYDADFEEDEMHHQLWLRQPSEANQFKRISAGSYFFRNQKVDLKIVYGQIFVTTVDDGQVVSMEEFLNRHGELTGPDTARKMRSPPSVAGLGSAFGRRQDAAPTRKVAVPPLPDLTAGVPVLGGSIISESTCSGTFQVASVADTSDPPSPTSSKAMNPVRRPLMQKQENVTPVNMNIVTQTPVNMNMNKMQPTIRNPLACSLWTTPRSQPGGSALYPRALQP
jgi:hypothetical protein